MAVQINSYGGLKAGVQQWMARVGDPLLDGRFDDHLAGCETRIYYGYATDNPNDPMHSDPLRIDEMETVDPAFVLQETVAQPTSFLELISAQFNSPNRPLQIVAQRTLDGYGTQSLGSARLIAVSGKSFRVKDDPAGATATLRYYQKLLTPTPGTANAILAAYPMLYLYGCLIEAAIMTKDQQAAPYYIGLYNSLAQGLNARTQRITASTVPTMRLRAGMTP